MDFEVFGLDGAKIAAVRHNNIYSGSKDAYEIDGGPDRLTPTEKRTGAVVVEIKKRIRSCRTGRGVQHPSPRRTAPTPDSGDIEYRWAVLDWLHLPIQCRSWRQHRLIHHVRGLTLRSC
jgi:hypothetical protein